MLNRCRLCAIQYIPNLAHKMSIYFTTRGQRIPLEKTKCVTEVGVANKSEQKQGGLSEVVLGCTCNELHPKAQSVFLLALHNTKLPVCLHKSNMVHSPVLGAFESFILPFMALFSMFCYSKKKILWIYLYIKADIPKNPLGSTSITSCFISNTVYREAG